MKKPRCDKCKFWVLSYNLEGHHRDDRIGVCRRHAPSPTLGDFQFKVLEMLWVLVHNIDPNDENGIRETYEEAPQQGCWWPYSTASDWCGEFKAKRK
jgi:hypothetical protein